MLFRSRWDAYKFFFLTDRANATSTFDSLSDSGLGIGRGNPGVCWGFAGVWLYLHNAVINYLEISITSGQYIWLCENSNFKVIKKKLHSTER